MMIPIVMLAIEGVNILLLLGLLYVYIGTYRKVKSKFTLGLIFFTSAFLLKSIMLMGTIGIIYRFLDTTVDFRGAPLILLLVNIIECAGLVTLLKISMD